ncbi:MAG: isoprenylcysteine carboxylmethyltransferase family protein [Candidatus Lokiarchaeota archaeon]|nr:isoprenylcysteine carboxylmethyltransferase family protein [Candidatus Lokiarchaeota archaeon]
MPKGSILVEKTLTNEEKQAPGNRWSQYSIIFGEAFLIGMEIYLLIHLIFGAWKIESLYLAIDLPVFVNWIGIIGRWISICWELSVSYYNINFTSVNLSIKNEYVLATGGPYKYIRHPLYVEKVVIYFFLFAATGIWFIFIGLIGFLPLLYQAKKEEEKMRQMFGSVYEDYVSKTGRFLPKIKTKFHIFE